jgi:hypothetical protein
MKFFFGILILWLSLVDQVGHVIIGLLVIGWEFLDRLSKELEREIK